MELGWMLYLTHVLATCFNLWAILCSISSFTIKCYFYTYKDKYVRIIIIPSESKRQCHGNIHWWLCAMTGGLEWKQWQKEKRKRYEKALVSYFTTHWKPSKTFDSFSSFLPVRGKKKTGFYRFAFVISSTVVKFDVFGLCFL